MGLRWLKSMSVGVVEFDNDHQHMILLMEEIAAALTAGDGQRACALADNLSVLAYDHTAREEVFLRRIGFPGLESLIAAQHDSLSRIATLTDAVREAGPDVIASMRDALLTYLLRADINYKSYVEARQIGGYQLRASYASTKKVLIAIRL